MKKLPAVLFLALLATLPACSKPVTKAPKINADDLAVEARAHKDILDEQVVEGKRYKTLSRKKVVAKIDRIAPRIQDAGIKVCKHIQGARATCIFKFEIKSSEDLNAYADGEKIYITTAMASFAQNDEELAMVLAHEYAHNIFNHSSSAATNSMVGGIAGLILDSVAGSQGINTGGMFSKMGQGVGALQYSVDFEQEADYAGMYILGNARYDMDKSTGFWRRMTLETARDGTYGNITHPSNPKRTLAIKKTVKEIKAKKAAGRPLLPEMKEL